MSLQETLQSITSSITRPSSLAERSSQLADDSKNIIAALMVLPRSDVRRMIDVFAPVAEAFLQEIVTGAYPEASLALRAKYASLALARAGFGPIHQVRSLTAALTKDDIEEIKARAAKAVHDNPQYSTSPIRRKEMKEITQSPIPGMPIPVSEVNHNTEINPAGMSATCTDVV